MSEWAKKRFWQAAAVVDDGAGFTVHLDGHPIKTPAGARLGLPGAAMAHAVAAEWEAQTEVIDPRQMPVTCSANAAIDRVMPQHAEVAAAIAAYGETDLLCYRADGPEALIVRQAQGWDPLLQRADEELGAPLLVTTGVIHRPQPADSLARLGAEVAALSAFELTALHDLVSLSGSLIIGLAAIRGWADSETLWQVSQIDESWQAERWGSDDEATKLTAIKRRTFVRALRFFALTQGSYRP